MVVLHPFLFALRGCFYMCFCGCYRPLLCLLVHTIVEPDLFRVLTIQISPRPGFVIKSKVVESGIKVFINICQHERIGKSEMIKKLDQEGNEVCCTVAPCEISWSFAYLVVPSMCWETVDSQMHSASTHCFKSSLDA